MTNDFGPGKSIFVLTIVVGCFALLWPNVFYPMIMGSHEQKLDPSSNGCCDVLFDSDVNAIKIMTELCEKILKADQHARNFSLVYFQEGKLNKDVIEMCHKSVYQKCGLNITEIIGRRGKLGKDYRKNLDNVRTLNSSVCLRDSFGISVGRMGLPRRMRIWGISASKHMKPERPPHLHPETMHPALREKGRAIPQSPPPSVQPKVVLEGRIQELHQCQNDTNCHDGKPVPISGMRPPMGGAGHVVPAPKGGGTMGIVMPMYTIGIVIFFLYTMMKLITKKTCDDNSIDFIPDTDFRREVFTPGGANGYKSKGEKCYESNTLVLTAITGLVQEVNKQIGSEQSVPYIKCQESDVASTQIKNRSVLDDDTTEVTTKEAFEERSVEDGKGEVKVIGMETTETWENGKHSRPSTPRPSTPQNIYLPGVIPDQSQIIVTDSTTQAEPDDENEVILSGKVTLSLIGIQESSEIDDTSNSRSAVFSHETTGE